MSRNFVRVSALAASALVCASLLGCSGAANNGSSNGATNSAAAGAATGSTPAATPAATLASISPTTAVAGTGPLTLTATGTGFTGASVLQIGTASLPTTLVSTTSLTAVVPAIQLAAAGTVPISVTTGAVATAAQGLSVQNPLPTIASMTPATVTVGALGATLTVNGTGFVPASSVAYNGTARQTTYLSATQLIVGLLAADLVSPGPGALTVSNSAPGGGTSSSTSVSVQNPSPAIASVSPATLLAGTAATTATVTGTGFLPGSIISVNGGARQTVYTGATQLTFMLTAADLANAGTDSLTVANAAPGGGTSATATISVQNPTPAISTLSPSTVAARSTLAAVTVIGSGFTNASTATLNGASRPTAFLSPTRLMVTLAAADLASTGTAALAIANPTPGGGTSNKATLTVATGAPTSPVLTGVSTNTILAGSPDTSVTLSGNGFDSTCTAQVNGNNVQTTFSPFPPSFGYSALIPASFLTTAATLNLDFACPQVTSNTLPLTVTNPPVPVLTNSSTLALPLNTAVSLTFTGTGFTSNTVVQLNGVSLPTTLNSTASLTSAVPSTAVTNLGAYMLTAYTPGPGGGTSAPLTATPYLPLASNSMVYNPANGLFYLSVPSSAGALYGNSIVSVDPVTGSLGTPLKVGSEPDHMAISTDGTVLWIGLDGGSSVAKVNLSAGTVAYRFSLPPSTGTASNTTAAALVAIPGSPDSVAVALTGFYNSSPAIQIYDTGVARTQVSPPASIYPAAALQIDGTRNELYAANGTAYYTYTYGPNGLTPKASNMLGSYAVSSNDDLQLLGGRLYTDNGRVYDAESGGLLGTLYSSGTTVTSGPTVADTALGRIFTLNTSYPYSTPFPLQIFGLDTFTTSSSSIPVSSPSNLYFNANSSHLTRWGSNGLAFRFNAGFISLRSNLVRDLSSTNADLSVAITAPSTAATNNAVNYDIVVSNAGPFTSTGVAVALTIPSEGILNTVTASQGTCSGLSCDLGTIASGSSATITASVEMLNSGTATLTASAFGSENDPTMANNNGAAAVTVTGAAYAPAPVLSSVSPSAIPVGQATDTTLTVVGANFTKDTVVSVAGTALSTTVISNTQLNATLPAANYASLGWAPLIVATPAPGGGTSHPLVLTYFQVITAGLNHMVYDPFSRKIMAAVGSGSSSLTGNAIVALTPDTGTFGTPVPIGSQPSYLALSSDGSLLYTILSGSQSVARFNMLTQAVDFTYTPTNLSLSTTNTLGALAVQPGFPNTIALNFGYYSSYGVGLFDFNPATKTATQRGSASNNYTNNSPQFLDAADLFTTDYSSDLDHFSVTATGFGSPVYTQFGLSHFGTFTIDAGLAFANLGGVASLSSTSATQLGYYAPLASGFGYNQLVAPDTNLARVFFLGSTSSTSYSPDGIIAYDQNTFLPTETLPLNLPTIEGNSSYTTEDLLRWGPDGLALLTNNHIYLLRGPAVLPAELSTNTTATLNSVSSPTVAKGSGNTMLTITGRGFLRGAAVQWNGTYRTTTWISATQLSFAVPASDLATTGSAAITVLNPGAPVSGAISLTIQ